MRKYLLPLVILGFGGGAQAQQEAMVMQKFQVSSEKTSSQPPIVITRRADFLLLQISIVNDTREEEKRRDEVYATLRDMVNGIPAGSKIQLFTEEFTLTATHFQITLSDLPGKRDTSQVTLYAKVPLAETDDAGVLSEKLRQFVRAAKGQGRAEIYSGDIGLSIKNPERYRYEVITAIAADVKKLREAFGDTFEIVVKGLDARLQWQRSSAAEVELYLPFQYELYPLKTPRTLVSEK